MISDKAEIHPSADIAPGVQIGPWTQIGAEVVIDAGCVIGSHVVIKGPTRIGRDNQIFPFACIGERSQDKKDKGERTTLEIGNGNTIREYATIHRGTALGGGVTRVGDDNWLMAYSHIAHDCQVGSHTIFSNNASIAGHVIVDDYAIISAFTAVHQFVRIGAHCFIGFTCCVTKDVLPFVMVAGHSPETFGLNTEGLRRRGFSEDTLKVLKQAYRIIFRQGLTVQDAIAQLSPLCELCPEVALLIEGLQSSTRGIVR